LPENDEHYRDLVENSLDLMCTHDLNGVILSVNLSAARTLGYEPDELVNRNIRQFLSPTSCKEFDRFLVAIPKQGGSTGFLRLLTKNGETRIWRYTSTLKTDGGQVRFVRGVAHDVTDILQAQKALRKSEQRLRVAAEVGKMYAWEWDPATDSVLRSAECTGILGLNGDARNGVAKDYFSLVHPDDRVRLWKLATSLTSKDPQYRTEYRRFHPDGRLLWLQESGHATFDKTGKMVRLVGMTADITDRKQAEEKLRASEERFQLAAQAGKMFAYEWDATTDVIVRSAESARILGINEATPITGQQILTKVHPDDRERLTAAVAKLSLENPSLEIRYRMVRPDGAVTWVERNSRAHFDEHGKMLRIIGMVADVTERKRTEEALRESEQRLRLAVQAGRMYAFEWDPVSDVIVRSGECGDILNWMPDPARDTSRQFIARVHPDDREMYRALEIGLTANHPIYHASYRVLRPDGKVLWLEESGHAFFDSQGKILRTIGMVADVTARKFAEEALASVSRRLIEAQEQERCRIARELHDDLGQRMALLQIGLEQFEQKMPELSSSDREELRNIVQVVSELSSDLHNLAHQLHPVKLDLQGLVAAMGGLCREFSKQRDLQVKFVHQNIPAQIPKAEALCLFRIVQEALRNVVKHGKTREAQVELFGHDDEIDLCVSDSGAGFNPESAEAKGGLGLISMRERLRLIGGYLTLESEPLHGTRIRVHVPLSSSAGKL
jgi:PAS domain S-box-containing protein